MTTIQITTTEAALIALFEDTAGSLHFNGNEQQAMAAKEFGLLNEFGEATRYAQDLVWGRIEFETE